MSDVSLAGAFLAGLVSFLSPCVLPLVPGYIPMLSGIVISKRDREAANVAFGCDRGSSMKGDRYVIASGACES